MAQDPIYFPMKLGPHIVPGIWNYMFPGELKSLKLPQERLSTCLSCPKAKYESFRPDYRCCTYFPRVPNFLIGLAIKEDDSARAVAQGLLDKGYLLPEGFITTPDLWGLYLADVSEDRFGKSQDVLCPFLKQKTGLCGIYAFRNSVCSTFFCLHDHGKFGEKFWNELQLVGSQIELALGQWCMQEAELTPKKYFKTLDSYAKRMDKAVCEVTLGWSQKALKQLWGPYYGKELEYFEACGELVSAHREKLWEIANKTDILEANVFDKASSKRVPKKYRDEIDEEDNEPGETARPKDMWKKLRSRYARLWTVPGDLLEINPKVTIGKNRRSDPEAKEAAEDRNTVVKMPNKKDPKEYEWRRFLTTTEVKALRKFSKPRHADTELLLQLNDSLDDPVAFLSECLGMKILVPARTSR